MLTMSLEKITPAEAIALLETNTNNRKLSKSAVNKYAEEMKAGRWKVNGETISVGKSGRLLNGQHRLNAIIKSGAAVDILIVRGVGDDTFDTMDDGIPRTASAVLGIAGHDYTHKLAAAVSVVMKVMSGNVEDWAKSAAPKSAVLQFVNDNQRITEIVREESKQKVITPSMAAGLRFLFEQASDADSANEFMRAIESGQFADGRFQSTDSNPAYRLREMLIANKSQRAQLRQKYVAAVTIKSWNSWIDGAPRRQVKLLDGEAFPKVLGRSVRRGG